MKQTKIILLSACAAVAAIISSCLGVFYTFGGQSRIVENIYGESVTLFGDGIYANDSILKAGATKGTDVVIIAAAVLLILMVSLLKRSRFSLFLRSGLLALILYASTCLVMGVSFTRLFPLYLLQFGCSLFAFIGSINELLHQKSFATELYEKRLVGTGIFLVIGGCSTLIWLMFIIPAVISGKPMEIIEIYTTEPTFVLDLAIITPTAIWCGIAMMRKKPEAYQLAPVLLTVLTGVGIIVIIQTIFQSSLGIILNPGQFFGLVISFVILGSVALILNVRLLRQVRK